MSFYGKLFTQTKVENLDGFFKAVGIPEDKIKPMVEDTNTVKITKNGDSYVLTLGSSKGSKDINFKSGVELEDVMGPTNTVVKGTITVSGNSFTHCIKTDKATATFKGEFSGDELVTTITSDKFDGVAKRYYKA